MRLIRHGFLLQTRRLLRKIVSALSDASGPVRARELAWHACEDERSGKEGAHADVYFPKVRHVLAVKLIQITIIMAGCDMPPTLPAISAFIHLRKSIPP